MANYQSGRLEPWDSDNFAAFYLAACVAAFALGAIAQKHAWLMGGIVVVSMLPVMLIANPQLGSLIGLGLLFLLILSLPAVFSSILGAVISRQIRQYLEP